MIDSGESDYKVLAVPVDDKRWEDVNRSAKTFNKHMLKEFQTFLLRRTSYLKGKPAPVEINGYQRKGRRSCMRVKKSVDALYRRSTRNNLDGLPA